MSRQHAMIEFQNGVYFMVDMGSTNGVEYQRPAHRAEADRRGRRLPHLRPRHPLHVSLRRPGARGHCRCGRARQRLRGEACALRGVRHQRRRPRAGPGDRGAPRTRRGWRGLALAGSGARDRGASGRGGRAGLRPLRAARNAPRAYSGIESAGGRDDADDAAGPGDAGGGSPRARSRRDAQRRLLPKRREGNPLLAPARGDHVRRAVAVRAVPQSRWSSSSASRVPRSGRKLPGRPGAKCRDNRLLHPARDGARPRRQHRRRARARQAPRSRPPRRRGGPRARTRGRQGRSLGLDAPSLRRSAHAEGRVSASPARALRRPSPTSRSTSGGSSTRRTWPWPRRIVDLAIAEEHPHDALDKLLESLRRAT